MGLVKKGNDMKLLLAGCTGFIGKELIKELKEKGHSIVLLVRDIEKYKNLENEKLLVKQWDGKSLGDWAPEIENVDGIINLTGEPIAGKRWTNRQKKVISSSRLDSTNALIEAINKAKKKPKVLINASAVGYYGNVEDGLVSENYKKGKGFLADICEEWENAAKPAVKDNVRVVFLRIGIVLEKGGGALEKITPPFMMFAGGPLGSGKQWFPWIHRDDVIGIILYALENENISGEVNTVAPECVTMKDFCSELGKVIKRPSWAPVPGIALKVLLGEMADMLLGGQHAIPEKLTKNGYDFKYKKVSTALKNIYE